jgi:hypothetical protein
VGRRSGPAEWTLAYAVGGEVDVDTVTIADPDEDLLWLRSLAGRDLGSVDAPATLIAHDFSVPDLDPGVVATTDGRLSRGRLAVTGRSGTTVVGRRPSLLGGQRHHRTQEHACRRELDEATRTTT